MLSQNEINFSTGYKVLYIIVFLILSINFNAFYRDLLVHIIEETILRTSETSNDNINKPLVFIFFNSLIFLMPVISSKMNNVNCKK